MWLLSTDRAELHSFPSVQAAQIARFAILSHVWDEAEQTFQDTQALCAQCARTNSNPRDFSSVKVRKSCELAEQHGYKWIWNDACCIDKTSSTELSEAINSMFAYYSHAEVCYAYLKDVPPDHRLDDANSKFRGSRWFKRGWTLQELLAPPLVIFLYSTWMMAGTKASLARLVSSVTGIPLTVLLLEEEIWDVSVARRMSWASKRETTRPEDEAYSLLGIFDINMPPFYGEGRKAFQRLQEEIMKKNIDSSLFAWISSSDEAKRSPLSLSPRNFYTSRDLFFAPDTLHKVYDSVVRHNQVSSRARPFRISATTKPTAYPPQFGGIPAFDITPYGIRARLPIVTTRFQGEMAILFVSDEKGAHICLPLEKCDNFADPTRPLYRRIPDSFSDLYIPQPSSDLYFPQLSPLPVFKPEEIFSQNTSEGRNRWEKFLATPWQTVYLAHSPQPQSVSKVQVGMNRDTTTPFYIPPGTVVEFMQRHPRIRLTDTIMFVNSPTWQPEFSATTLIFNYELANFEAILFGVSQ